jgi:hypothetical protein
MTAEFVIVSKLFIGVDIMLMFVFKVVIELFTKTETIFQLPEVFFRRVTTRPAIARRMVLK